MGDETALAIYRRLGARALAAAQAVPGCEVELRFTPDDGRDAVASWLGDNLLMRPQSSGDLGARMHSAVADAMAAGIDAVVIVGTDCPALDGVTIEQAFAHLGQADVVLGPACDGGYYLIAMQQAHAVLFDEIPWSTPDTLARTIAAAQAAGLRIGLLDERADIDTAEDWRRWLASRLGGDDGPLSQ